MAGSESWLYRDWRVVTWGGASLHVVSSVTEEKRWLPQDYWRAKPHNTGKTFRQNCASNAATADYCPSLLLLLFLLLAYSNDSLTEKIRLTGSYASGRAYIEVSLGTEPPSADKTMSHTSLDPGQAPSLSSSKNTLCHSPFFATQCGKRSSRQGFSGIWLDHLGGRMVSAHNAWQRKAECQRCCREMASTILMLSAVICFSKTTLTITLH